MDTELVDVFSLSQVGEVCNLFPFLLRFLKTVAVGGVTRAFIYLRAIVGEAPVWAPSPLSHPECCVCVFSVGLCTTDGARRWDVRPPLAPCPQRVPPGGDSR